MKMQMRFFLLIVLMITALALPGCVAKPDSTPVSGMADSILSLGGGAQERSDNAQMDTAGVGGLHSSVIGGLTYMRKLALLLIVSVAFAIFHHTNMTLASEQTSVNAAWSSKDEDATWSNEGFLLSQSVWQKSAGEQTIWANAYNRWGVWANYPESGGVKSYPHIEKAIHRKLGEIKTLKSRFQCRVPGSGAYSTAYTIRCNHCKYEIILWMNQHGDVQPVAGRWDQNGKPTPAHSHVSVGGHVWNVYKGTNGSNQVFTFVRNKNTSSAAVDLKAICDWIKAQSWFDDVVVDHVQLGWEVTSSSGGLNFQMNGYSVTSN